MKPSHSQLLRTFCTAVPLLSVVQLSTAAEPSAALLPMNCTDSAIEKSGHYLAKNNTWGKGTLTGWSQCIGIASKADGTLRGRWAWNWPSTNGKVKSYPEIIFGLRPNLAASTHPSLPKRINEIRSAEISYDLSTRHSGSGNLAFDIWLSSNAERSTFSSPPLTHEIMIWLETYGSMAPNGTFLERTIIDGSAYNVYHSISPVGGWSIIVFESAKRALSSGKIQLHHFLTYLLERHLVTSDLYLASILLGNEVVSGKGETILDSYSIAVQ